MSSSKNAKKKRGTGLPPHANAAVHQAIMKMLSTMSAHEIFETAVKSGIYTKKGKLKKPYAAEADDARLPGGDRSPRPVAYFSSGPATSRR